MNRNVPDNNFDDGNFDDVNVDNGNVDAVRVDDVRVAGTRAYGFHVVGIGASAGGLEALEALFRHMPSDSGAAFVVVQHLSPDFESHMDDLLARQTDIPIYNVSDRMLVEPNAIYLLPPRKEMIISSGRLLLTEKEPDRGLVLPIDYFFRSLAQDVGRHSIAIILSGTGSDGSRGIQEVHQAGGLVLCQQEETARFDGMPLSAIATGVTDLVLAPEAMPAALSRYVSESPSREELAGQQIVPPTGRGLEQILKLLRDEYSIDFSHYKPHTVMRRIERRLSVHSNMELPDYVELLRNNPEELNSLYHDLLIGVTRFFRDAPAFEQFEQKVIPDVLDRTSESDEIRVWVAGCATGEEVYSIAILLHEQLMHRELPPNVKVFATDVHRGSLEFASAGVYSEESLEEVTDARRARYFQKDSDGYHVSSEVRKMVVFAAHNVLTDAPFMRMDLVTCRNLLIYLQPNAQKAALSLFHFGLKTRGLLFLGSSESVGELSDEFETVDSRWKIYRKLRDVRLATQMRIPEAGKPAATQLSQVVQPGNKAARQVPAHEVFQLYDRLLQRFMPAGFLVSESFQLLHTFGDASRFLAIRQGWHSSNVLDLIHPDLRTPLSGTLHHSLKERETTRFANIRVGEREDSLLVDLHVELISDQRGTDRRLLVTLERVEAAQPLDAVSHEVDAEASGASHDHVEALESELRFTRENLQATVEELETSNEELQATNEELVASNEELQSTNEELHSVNEELYTVNTEHQRKIHELTEMTEDLDNLLKGTELGILFLDQNLCIRKFTPRMEDVFSLMPQDVGRPIRNFTHSIDHPDLVADLERTLAGETTEREVQDRDGDSYFLRILPYHSTGESSGVVMTLIDIQTLKQEQHRSEQLAAIVESSQDAIIAQDLESRITAWNQGAEQLFGYAAHEAIGRRIYDLIVPEDRREELRELQQRVVRGEAIGSVETVRQRRDGSRLDVSLLMSPITSADGEVVGISVIDRDIKEFRQVSRRLERSREEAEAASSAKSIFLANMSHEVRTPMTAVLGLAEMLRAEVDNPEHTEMLDMIVENGRYLTELLNDILDLTRIEADRLEIDRVDVSPIELLKNLHTLMDVRAKAERLQLHTEIDGAIPQRIQTDPVRLRQILVNLLGNAIKFTDTGEIRLVASLKEPKEADDGARFLQFDVIDTGPGIGPHLLETIFEEFSQGESSPRDRASGAGLGLAISRRLASALGGTLTATSEPGTGSRFTLQLPLRSLEGIALLDETAEFVEKRSTVDSGIPRLDLTGRKILLVEDTRANQFLVQRLLERLSAEVTVVENGREALETIALQGDRFDLVLMDMHMPVMDGYEATRTLREMGGATPVVALTASSMDGDRDRCLAAGCSGYISKPIDRQELESELARVLGSASFSRPVGEQP